MTRALPRSSEHNLRRCRQCGLKKPATREYFKKELRNRTGCAARCRLCMSINRYVERIEKLYAAGPLEKTPPWLTDTPEYSAYHHKQQRLYARMYKANKAGDMERVARLRAWRDAVREEWLKWVNAQPKPVRRA